MVNDSIYSSILILFFFRWSSNVIFIEYWSNKHLCFVRQVFLRKIQQCPIDTEQSPRAVSRRGSFHSFNFQLFASYSIFLGRWRGLLYSSFFL